MRYAVVVEKSKRNYSAYLPDVAGCIATRRTVQETLDHLRDALSIHYAANSQGEGFLDSGRDRRMLFEAAMILTSRTLPSHIVFDEHGRPWIEGTGRKVIEVAIDSRAGLTAAEIHATHPDLPMAKIHAALELLSIAGTRDDVRDRMTFLPL